METTVPLANKGVGGVAVKLTEGAWYKNPRMRRTTVMHKLPVCKSTYHFSMLYLRKRAEARFLYIAEAQRLNFPKNTLMVNDLEDAKMQAILTATPKPGRTNA